MFRLRLGYLLGSLFGLISFVFAQQSDLELRAQALERKLMAPCCWGSVIADHSSEVAMEMKTQIRSKLEQGQSESAILAEFSSIYGERVLAQPTSEGFNLAVWIIPFIALILGAGFLSFALYRWFGGSKTSDAQDVASPSIRTPQDLPPVAPASSDDAYYQRLNQELLDET